MPLVLPPTVLGFYLLLAFGPNGPGGMIAGLWGGRTLAFTFEGLVIGSVVYSMPFVVQPIRNAFEAIGDRPLEVAATLRASPWRAFWTVAVPLARPGFLTGAVLGFAHTVGEFGIVLMIGGNIPGKTKVLVGRDLRLRRDHAVARGQYSGRRHGDLRLCRHTRDDADRKARRARGPVMSARDHQGGVFAARSALSRSTRRSKHPRAGVTALFGPSGCGKTTVLRCIAGLNRLRHGFCAIDGEIWQDASSFLPTHRRPIGYVFQEASLFPHLSVRRNLLYGAGGPRRAGRRTRFASTRSSICSASRPCSIGRRVIFPAASASASRSAARCCRSQNCMLMDEPLSALDRQAKDEILPFLERLHESLSLPVIYVAHDMDEIERLADHLVLMDAGRVVAAGPLAALQSDPQSSAARAPGRRRSVSTPSWRVLTPITASPLSSSPAGAFLFRRPASPRANRAEFASSRAT